MAIWKPTRSELAAIRKHASLAYGKRNPSLKIAERVNLDDGRVAMNILLTSEHEDWNDTDLSDKFELDWFKQRGVELTADGKAVLDFYVYDPDDPDWHELLGNIQVYYQGGKINHFGSV